MSNGVAKKGLSLLVRPQQREAALWRRLRFEQEPQCRERLFNLHVGLARAIAYRELRRRPAYGLDRADFEQLACTALLESIDRFDPLNGAPFEAFARARIRGAISDGIARSSEAGAYYTHKRRIEIDRLRSLHREAGEDADPLTALSDVATALAIGLVAESARLLDADGVEQPELAAYESVAWRDLQLSVLREIDKLPDKERSVIRQHYLNGLPFTEIARMLSLTKGRISQMHRAALKRVREGLRSCDQRTP